MDPSDIFHELQTQKSERQGVWEFCKVFRLPTAMRQYLEEVVERRGGDWSIDAWHQAFPDFPLNLSVRVSQAMRTIGKPHILFNSESLSKVLGKRFFDELEQWEATGDGRPFVLALKFANDKDWYAIHDIDNKEWERSRLISPLYSAAGRKRIVTIEKLLSLTAICKDELQTFISTWSA